MSHGRRRRGATVSVIALLTLAGAMGCAPSPPPLALDVEQLPAIAAQYRTTQHRTTRQPPNDRSPARTVTWRFWREDARLASENLTERIGQRWQRDGTAIFAQVLFHDRRHTLEYQPDDWGLLGLQPNWAERCLLIDPEVLRKLEPRAAMSIDGHPVQRFVGVIDEVRWDVSVRTDLMLPTKISKRAPQGWERTVLTEVHDLRDAPWQPPLAAGYRIVAFADIGDAASGTEAQLLPPVDHAAPAEHGGRWPTPVN